MFVQHSMRPSHCLLVGPQGATVVLVLIEESEPHADGGGVAIYQVTEIWFIFRVTFVQWDGHEEGGEHNFLLLWLFICLKCIDERKEKIDLQDHCLTEVKFSVKVTGNKQFKGNEWKKVVYYTTDGKSWQKFAGKVEERLDGEG